MKVKDFNLRDWQNWFNKYKTVAPSDFLTPIAMRIENTPLTTARYMGGMKYNGQQYTYFEPVVPGKEPNPDGTPYVAWLMVRQDFLMWVTKQLEGEKKKTPTDTLELKF